MDAHGRGRADGIGPADQWVRDSHADDHELRPDRSGKEPTGVPRAPDRPGRRGNSRPHHGEEHVRRARRAAGNGRAHKAREDGQKAGAEKAGCAK